MVSERAKNLIESDYTKFFGRFIDDSVAKDKMYDLSVGNINRIKIVNDVLQSTLKNVMKKTSLLTKYPGTQGYKPLNEKICNLIKIETGKDVNPEEILLTNGGVDGIYNIAYSFCNPNDYCYYALPSFPYWSITDKAEVRSSVVVYNNPFRYKETFGTVFRQKVEKNDKIKMVILNEPHNPIGASINRDQVKIINEVCNENNILCVLDEVYRSFKINKDWIGNHVDNNILLDSFSKRFGMPGLRLGFIHAPEKEIEYLRPSFANQAVGVNMFSLLLANEVLENAFKLNLVQKVSDEIKERQKNLDKHMKKLKKYDVISEQPDGGMYRLMLLNKVKENTGLNATDICERLKQNNVKTVPGNKLFIYNSNPNKIPEIIRLSVGGDERTDEAGELIIKTFEEIYAEV